MHPPTLWEVCLKRRLCFQVNEYRGDSGAINRIFPQPVGSKLVYEGDNKSVYMFNPVNDSCLPLPQCTGALENVLWDLADANLFAVLEGAQCHTFLYHPLSITGPTIKFLGGCMLRHWLPDSGAVCCSTQGRCAELWLWLALLHRRSGYPSQFEH